MSTDQKFPPDGFTLIVPIPRMWEPNDHDHIVGYPADIRGDMIGIMLSQPFKASGVIVERQSAEIMDVLYIDTKREEIRTIGDAYFFEDVERNAEGQPVTDDKGKTKPVVKVNEIAIQWCAETETYAVALRWADMVSMQQVLTDLTTKRTAAMAAKNAAAPVAPPSPPSPPAPPIPPEAPAPAKPAESSAPAT